ncbi:MAG: efflux RND transporter periplasmic adaptor subunit [Proteobacteria bacterium]|nr:efflux RND transporter periplasmic adaptor subunit [Pseudomonadota bacterium]
MDSGSDKQHAPARPAARVARWAAAAAAAAVIVGAALAQSPRSPQSPDGAPAAAAALATAAVSGGSAAEAQAYDGVVEAARQTTVAAQVPGVVVTLAVQAGDAVRAGQVLARLDARAADQTAAAGDAQVRAARALQEAATKEVERQRRLFERHYISQAALDRAEAQHRAAEAQVAAQIAGAGAAHAQSTYYTITAPYDGIVASVPAVAGDMALPGKPLLVVYDPHVLRVSAALPQSAAARLPAGAKADVRVELPELPEVRRWIEPAARELLPTVDPATHTRTLRLGLPAGLAGVAPGLFARVWLSGVAAPAEGPRLYVPARSVVRRAELSAVYVVGADGRPALRQVRTGPVAGDRIEVLAGLAAGERVALDPQAAAARR